MKKKKKDIRPGIRIPTAKGSIAFKDGKTYDRKREKRTVRKIKETENE